MKILLCCCTVFCLISCERFNDQELDVFYLQVPKVLVQANPGQFSSQNIRDLWVYSDDIFQGTFPIPATIPMFRQDHLKLKIYPGIRQYGIQSLPEIFILQNPFLAEVFPTQQDSVILQPIFSYKNNLITALQEGFESSSIFTFDLDSFPGSSILRTSKEFQEGSFGGLAVLTDKAPELEVASIKTIVGKGSWGSAYLEMDIKTDVDIKIGLIVPGSPIIKNYFFVLRPTPEWKKVYLPLTEALTQINSETFQCAFKAELTTKATASFVVDNIRIICLP